MGTFDVTLPDTQPIVFPPLCVVCEKENPDGLIKLSFLGAKSEPVLQMAADRAVGFDVDPKYYGGNTLNKIDGIPACKGCSSRLKRYHWGLQFGYYTAWIPGLVPIVAFPHVSTIITVPWMILCAVSPGVYTLLRPPSFGASFFQGKANFEFKSQKVAEAFMHLNVEAIEKGKAEAEKVKLEKAAMEQSKSEETAPQ